MHFTGEIKDLENYETISEDRLTALKLKMRELVKLPESFKLSVEHVPNRRNTPLSGFICRINFDKYQFDIDIDVSGAVNTIYKTTSTDVEQIRNTCEFERLPWTLDGTLEWDNGMKYNGDPVVIRNLHSKSDIAINIEHIPMPEHNQKGMFAFAANCGVSGMNICAALFCPATKTIFHWVNHTFDDPEGIAAHHEDNDICIYVNKSGRQCVYNRDAQQSQDPDISHKSNWINLQISDDFKRLKKFITMWTRNPDLDNMTDYYNQLSEQISKEQDPREIVRLADQYLSMPYVEEHSEWSSQMYSYARALSGIYNTSGHLRAIKALTEIEYDIENWEDLKTDPDFDLLHNYPEWQTLVGRH